MTNQDKIQIALNFVSLHKNSDIDQWQPLGVFGDKKALFIYDSLVNDVYGETSQDDTGECRIEIDRFDSATGNPVEFFFEQ